MIDKSFKDNFYDGVFSALKSELTANLPPERVWTFGQGMELFGNPDGTHNVHQTPYNNHPAWIEISFSERYIFPTHYFLEGRRHAYKSMLKSWEFEGLTLKREWKTLHSQYDQPFEQHEKRLFSLNASEFFIGFRVNMTDKNTDDNWALCLGQIEVFGSVFSFLPIVCDANTIDLACDMSLLNVFCAIVQIFIFSSSPFQHE